MTVSVTLIVVPVVEQPDSTAARVLLVEDDVAIADLIQLYLDEEGLESTAVASAEQAEAELRRVVFHLLILDLNLPGRDGFQFLEQFRTRQSTPVIIVSARDSDEDKVLGLGVGADDFVTKPFSPRVLVARVRASLRYLQRHPRRRSAPCGLATTPYIWMSTP